MGTSRRQARVIKPSTTHVTFLGAVGSPEPARAVGSSEPARFFPKSSRDRSGCGMSSSLGTKSHLGLTSPKDKRGAHAASSDKPKSTK
jgi:hypothetical protein